MREDNELFELCKEVYKRTGWGNTKSVYESFIDSNGNEQCNIMSADSPYLAPHQYQTPLYTSDYLLEKLPNKIENKHSTGWLTLSPMGKEVWSACYEADHTEHIDNYKFEWSNTPLKALLKLTISLHEAGELKL